MTYADAVGFLGALTDYEKRTSYRYDDKAFGPERARRMLAALGHPDRGYRSVVVAGTKGKGSVCAMLAAILTAAGRRTGLYTSPHLVEWRERIRIGPEPVSPGEFGRLAGAVAPLVEAEAARGPAHRSTTFEALTVMASRAFADAGCDTAVLEVGLGGRLDAVNAVDGAVAVVAPVSFDHTDQLGGTIREIAGEKAGIIRPAAPVVTTTAHRESVALDVILAAAASAGAPVTIVGREWVAADTAHDGAGVRFDLRGPGLHLPSLAVPLAGLHQAGNAALAVAAARALEPALPGSAIRAGLAAVRWPGRIEWRAPDVLVDGAHNEASAEALAAYLASAVAPRPVTLVFGMLGGKDHATVARLLCARADRVICVAPRHPRAVPAARLAAISAPFASRCGTAPSAAAAVAAAREPGARVVVVAGSLALAGEVVLS